MTSRTGDKKFHNNCEKCKYLHFEVQGIRKKLREDFGEIEAMLKGEKQ